jgi:hypothetical protein
MPLFDYECPSCGEVKEFLITPESPAPLCIHLHNNRRSREIFKMDRLPSAPATPVIKGFSAKNGYAGGQQYEVKQKDRHIKVVVNT